VPLITVSHIAIIPYQGQHQALVTTWLDRPSFSAYNTICVQIVIVIVVIVLLLLIAYSLIIYCI